MNKLHVILNDTPRFLARARNDMGVILNPTKSRVKNLGVILVTFLVLTAVFLYFTKGTKAVGWWPQGSNYKYRKQLTVTNNSASALSSGTTIAISIDTKALFDTGKIKSPSCADLRITYQPSSGSATELTRYLSVPAGLTCGTSTATKVFFQTQASLAAAAGSSAYFMYYGNATATAPTGTASAFNVGSINATLVCPFDGSTTCAAGETPSTESGAIRYTGSKSAMSFFGNDNINIGPSAGTMAAKESFTIEAWINPSKYVVGDLQGIVHFTDSLRLALTGSSGKIDFRINAPGALASTNAIPLNTWTHVAGTYDGTTLRLFINGVLNSSATGPSSAVSPGCGSVGADYNSCITTLPIRPFNGLIDEVRISSVARYTSNFTPQTTPFVRDSQTKLLLHLDENGADSRSSTRAFDDSGKGWHGLIQNSPAYVSGFVGTDNGTTDTGTLSRQAYAAHEGMFLEQGTTNKITDPSFENATYNTVWGTVGANLTGGLTSSAPFYKFGTQSFRGIGVSAAISGTSNMETISINPGSTASHTLSFFAYDDTSTNQGGTITSNIVKPVWEGTAQSSGTYTDMGGGWWRVSYTAATTNASNQYGFEIQPNRLVYVDGVQLEAAGQFGEASVATTYTDGSLGVGYSWSGTAHNATTTRTAYTMTYSSTSNIAAAQGTISGWFKFPTGTKNTLQKPLVGWGSDCSSQYSLQAVPSGSNYTFKFITDTTLTSSSVSVGTDKWIHVVATYNASGRTIYVNGTSVGSDGNANGLGSLSTVIYLGDWACNGTKMDNTVYSDLRVYDDVLNSTQVTDLYQAGLVGYAPGNQVDQDGGFDTKGDNATTIWHMDEGSGSTVFDSSVQLNNATLGTGSSAPTWTVSTTGNSNARNTSLKFDGSNDFASRNVDTDFDFGTGSFSISGWFRHPSSVSGTDTLLARYRTAGYKVYMNSSGYICFDIDDDNSWTPDDSSCTTTSYADSNWHQFTAVKTSTTSITIYVDGKAGTADSSIAASGSLDNNAILYVGIDSEGVNNPWDGFIDDIYIYPYARSAAQIKTDYAAGSKASGVLGANTNDPLMNGLEGYWKLDEASGDAADASGNSITLTNNNLTSYTSGKFGLAANTSGSNNKNLTTTTGKAITGANLTVAGWINRATSTAEDVPICLGSTTNGIYTMLITQVRASGNYMTATMGNQTVGQTANNIISTGQWYHMAWVYDGNGATNADRLKFFLNGVQQTLTFPTDVPTSLTSNGSRWALGSYYSSTNMGDYWDGSLDEMRVYSRSLSPGEVQQLYNFAPGPIHYWKFDDRSGPTALDIGSSAINGTLTSNPRWTSGKFGSALSYNNGPYVDAGDVSYADWTGFSVGSWVYWDGTTHGGYEGLYSKQTTNSDLGRLLIKNDGQILVQTANGSFTSNAAGDVPSNTWAYISYIYDQSAGYEYLYVNGILKGSLARTGNVTQDANSLRIGWGHVNNTAYTFSGKIDDFKIYNYARTQKQIVEDMNAGLNLRAGSVGGASLGAAVGYWKFDEGQGTVANNAGIGNTAASDYNGTLGTGVSAPSWTNSGKHGKALTFDGGDKVTSTIADPTYTHSFSMWLNPTTSVASKTILTAGKLTTDSSSRPVYGGCTGTALSLSTWTHLVVVSDGSSVCKIYQNGVQTASSTTGVTFGTLVNIGAGSFIGTIDEVKYYNYALTPAEIKTDYNRGQSLVLGATGNNSTYAANAANQEYCVPGDSTSCAGPVGEWKLDERSGSTANDTSGNGNMGTLTGGPLWKQGKYGSSVYFDGTTTRYVTVADSSSLDVSTALTINAWVYPTANPSGAGGGAIIAFKSGAYNFELKNSGILRAYITGISSPGYHDATTALTLNRWSFVTLSYSSSAGQILMYINGVLDKTVSSLSGSITNSAGAFQIGAASTNPDQYNFYGSIDQVQVYNYVRTPAQVAWDYNRGGPVAQYKFDECSGGTAYDASGNGNTGTLTIGASGTQTSNGTCGSGTSTEVWSNGASGKFNSSMNFDGTDDYVSAANSTALQLGSIGTMGAWIKPASIDQFRVVMEKGVDWWNNHNSYSIYMNSLNRATCTINTSSTQATVSTQSNALSTGSWYHIVCTWDGTTMRMYVNGAQNNTSLQGGVRPDTSTASFYIGKPGTISGGGTYYFSGQIDDVRVYNYALTATQIKNLYNGGNSVYYGPASGQP